MASTRSHRDSRSVIVRAADAPTSEALAAFKADMVKVGLWAESDFGHWVLLYISV